VQFTRNSQGIADALKVIGGYVPGTLVHAARANEMSHIFFGQIEHHLWQVFATHPPLPERIRRVDPRWDGQFIQRKPRHYARAPRSRQDSEAGVGRAAIATAAILAGAEAAQSESEVDADFVATPHPDLEADTASQQGIPVAYVRHSHEPLGAQALVCSLLMAREAEVRGQQLAILADSGIRGLAELVNTLSPGVLELGAPRRLPLLELCLPALKAMSLRQYRAFKNTLLQLIQADTRTELHEWCLFQLVRHYLDPEFIQVKPSRSRYRRLQKVADHLRVTLSVLAHEGSGETDFVFRHGANELGFTDMQLMPLEQCSVAAFSRAVHELAHCYPLLKPRILKALALAASADGRLNPSEREIIASMAAVMDCPVPMALDG
jgi:hypothetical protein